MQKIHIFVRENLQIRNKINGDERGRMIFSTDGRIRSEA